MEDIKFVSIKDEIKDAILDIRYFSNYNFVGERIDGYLEPIALISKDACIALKKAADEFRNNGYLIKIYDAYRPIRAVEHFVRWAKDLSDIKMKEYFYPDVDKSELFEKGYIAYKSSHSRGSCIDLTLVDINTNKDIDMGSTFDYFGMISHIDYKDISETQLNNRLFLKEIMINNGFIPIKEEWWHFTLKDEPYSDRYFDFPVSINSISEE